MSNEASTKKPNIIKSILIAVMLQAILLGVAVGLFPLIGLPGWPLIFFLFYYVNIAHMEKEKLWMTAIGGFIGMTVSFSPQLLGLVVSDTGIGKVVLLILITALVTILIDGRLKKVIDGLGMMMVVALLPPGLHIDLPAQNYLPAVASYVIAVLGFALAAHIMTRRAAAKAEESAA